MKKSVFLFLTFAILLSACAPVSLAASKEHTTSDDRVAVVFSDKVEISSVDIQEPKNVPLSNIEMTADTCPVTLPSEKLFAPPTPYPATAPYAGEFWYGTELLWTALPTDGKWSQLARGEKMFWWREGFDGTLENKPRLSISTKRLDTEAPIVEFGPPATNAYHPDFHWAMLIGVELASTGCWEITGHYDKRELSFVVWVGD